METQQSEDREVVCVVLIVKMSQCVPPRDAFTHQYDPKEKLKTNARSQVKRQIKRKKEENAVHVCRGNRL